MLWRADVYVGQLVALLKQKGMWNDTLIVYSADNGGVGDGINYPLRGEKVGKKLQPLHTFVCLSPTGPRLTNYR